MAPICQFHKFEAQGNGDLETFSAPLTNYVGPGLHEPASLSQKDLLPGANEHAQPHGQPHAFHVGPFAHHAGCKDCYSWKLSFLGWTPANLRLLSDHHL